METLGQPRPMPVAHAPKSKPDPRPMRLALGAGGVAALSALTAAIVMPPQYSTPVQQPADPAQQAAGQLTTDPAQGSPSVLYVQLAPGQTAPPGAIVIDASAAPGAAGGSGTGTGAGTGSNTSGSAAQAGTGGGTTVTPVVTPKPTPKPTPAPIKTTQSGKVKK